MEACLPAGHLLLALASRDAVFHGVVAGMEHSIQDLALKCPVRWPYSILWRDDD
jgi:hypothetical protein